LFTDSPVTPCRLEILIDVLRDFGRKEWSRADLISVLQPKGLPDTQSNDQARNTVGAAKELGLITEGSDGLRLTLSARNESTRDLLLSILDEKVVSAVDIEPYYAPFFAYLLHMERDSTRPKDGEAWAIRFNQECPRFAKSDNAFNKTKYTGLNRWYDYTGHGWEDTAGIFQPYPYRRVERALNKIFGKERRLEADKFFQLLSVTCPELDGGEIFMGVAPTQYDLRLKQLSSGLSHALVDLHQDRVIQLHCPLDSRGWSIESAQPPIDGELMRSSRIDHVEYAR
jgi:hypothetical protein